MKALSLVAVIVAAFFIIIGISSKRTAGSLSYTVIFAGAVILLFVAVIWILAFVKEKRERNGKT